MAASPDPRRRIIRLWLLAVAALVLATVLIGGTTRLTRSGLAIVEWKPVTGILPPLSQQEWQAEFQKYQTIPQYRELNRGMSLGDFKTIYWWEWTHRLLGRLIGAAFFLPFLFFLWRGWIEPRWRARLWGIFGLGALQGAVGWWMVASGLSERVSVSQYWLAFHLTLGCLIYAALLWTAQLLAARPSIDAPARIRASAAALLVLVLMQIYLGALVAGLDAGLIYNTWPLIDGALVPPATRLWFLEPAWRNIFENALTAQFNHRMVAYALFIGALLHAIDARHSARGTMRGALTLALAITLQAGIGIVTLLHQAALPLALLHQGMAMVVLTIAVVHVERSMNRRAMPASGAAAPISPIRPRALARDRQ